MTSVHDTDTRANESDGQLAGSCHRYMLSMLENVEEEISVIPADKLKGFSTTTDYLPSLKPRERPEKLTFAFSL